jgi:hypothetical protein
VRIHTDFQLVRNDPTIHMQHLIICIDISARVTDISGREWVTDRRVEVIAFISVLPMMRGLVYLAHEPSTPLPLTSHNLTTWIVRHAFTP